MIFLPFLLIAAPTCVRASVQVEIMMRALETGGVIERCECGVSSSTAHLPRAPRFKWCMPEVFTDFLLTVCVASVEIQTLEMYGIIERCKCEFQAAQPVSHSSQFSSIQNSIATRCSSLRQNWVDFFQVMALLHVLWGSIII